MDAPPDVDASITRKEGVILLIVECAMLAIGLTGTAAIATNYLLNWIGLR
jgi:hypothetical protein